MRLKLPVLSVTALVCVFFLCRQVEGQTPQPSSNFGGLLAAPSYATGGGFGTSADNQTFGLSTGDFNHDGLPDLVSVTSTGQINVLLNDGKGGLSAPLVSTPGLVSEFNSAFPSSRVAVADLNGDGYDDLVIGLSESFQPQLYVALNQGNGTFATVTALALPYTNYSEGIAYPFALGATTTSGHIDIVLVQPATSQNPTYLSELLVTTYVNDGTGNFPSNVQTTYSVSSGSSIQGTGNTVALADANHDGKLDLFFLRQQNSGVYTVDVASGNGDGTFQAPPGDGTVSIAATNPPDTAYNLAVTDVTGNPAKQDILIAEPDGVAVALSNGDGSYQTPVLQVAPPFNESSGLQTADLNGDGKPDVIYAGDGSLSIYLGNGDGSFAPAAGNYTSGRLIGFFTFGGPPVSVVAAADFNGDGHVDFATADPRTGLVEVAAGKGDGTFAATPLLTLPTAQQISPNFLAAAVVTDLNGDGLDDFLSAGVFTALADGKGGFQYTLISEKTYPVAFVEPIRADFNGDGKQDAVVVGDDHTIAVALSNGDGTLQAPVVVPFGMTLACNLGQGAAGDLNGDGKADLVIPYPGDASCIQNSTGVASGFFVALGNGDGTFQPASFTVQDNLLFEAALGAFHGSAAPLDLITGGYGTNPNTPVSILTGKGDGTFGAPTVVVSTQVAYQLLTNDFNQDGKADLTVIGYTPVFLQSLAAPVAVLQFAGNGDGTFAAPVSLGSRVTGFSGSYTDLNGDGVTDLVLSSDTGLSVMLGTGNGGLASPILYFAPWDASPVLTGNFLGDNTQSVLMFVGGSLGLSGGTGFYKNLGGTSFTLTTPGTSVDYGQSLSLTAALTATIAGRPDPSGTVTFFDGTTSLGTSSAPNATFDTGALSVGSHSISAVYAGDANFNPNTSSPLMVTVSQASTTTTLAASSQTVVQGASVTFTATVAGTSGAGTPTGSVSFMNGSTALGSGNLNSSGVATLATSSLASGTASITAVYSGDTLFAGSTSSAVTVTVTAPLPPTFAVSGTAVTTAAGSASGNTSTISVTPANGFAGVVNLSAALTSSPAGAVDLPTISLAASSLTVAGASAVTTTATISTTASTSSSLAYPASNRWYAEAGSLALACVAFFAVPRRRRQWFWAATVAGLVIAFGATGCGGGGGSKPPANPGTTQGSYVFTITGTDAATGKITATGAVNVTVN